MVWMIVQLRGYTFEIVSGGEMGWNEGGVVSEDMRLYFVFCVIDYVVVGFVFSYFDVWFLPLVDG